MSISFLLQKNETGIRTKYAQNPRSMQQSEYLSVLFVCKKPIDEDDFRNGNNGIALNGDGESNVSDCNGLAVDGEVSEELEK